MKEQLEREIELLKQLLAVKDQLIGEMQKSRAPVYISYPYTYQPYPYYYGATGLGVVTVTAGNGALTSGSASGHAAIYTTGGVQS